MEIIDKTTRWNFEDIEAGECFMTYKNEDLFLKIKPFYDEKHEKIWNAIRFRDGGLLPFHPYERVRKVKAKIEYEEI